MQRLQIWLRQLTAIIRRDRLEQDLADELAFHLSMREADHRDAGASANAAAVATHRQFGSVSLAKESARDAWIPPALQALTQDIRFAARLLIKDPRFSLAVIAALALGIGANTTAFTLVNGTILRPLPFATPDQLVRLRPVDARNRPIGISFADARDWRTSSRMLSHVIVALDFAMTISGDEQAATRYLGSFISPDAFAMLGQAPLLGRTFTEAENRQDAPRVAVIAYSLWQNRYQGDRAIVGRTVRINDNQATIIGVMPERFHFPLQTEIWEPAAVGMGPAATIDQRRGNRGVTTMAYGRLADNVTRAQAQAEVDAITSRLAKEFPATNTGVSLALEPMSQFYREGIDRILLLMMGAVAFVLLIACVDVANLLLSRAVYRTREISIRASLGATRWRVVRQLMVESLLLSSVAGVVGFAIAVWAVGVFGRLIVGDGDAPPPFWLDFSMDLPVFVFLVALCVVTTVLFGLPPALHVSRSDVGGTLKDGGRGATGGVRARRWTGVLVAAQLALTLVLLSGAALMLRGFLDVSQRARVLDTTNLLVMRVSLGSQQYRDIATIKAFHRTLDERLAANATFASVTVASDVPLMAMGGAVRQLGLDGRSPTAEEKPSNVAYLAIGPRYFRTLHLTLLRGREFNERDGSPGEETAIVNQRFASMFFPDGDAIGHRLQLTNAGQPNVPAPWLTIVGIAPTITQFVGSQEAEPMVYAPMQAEVGVNRFASIIARTNGDSEGATRQLREEIRRIDPSLAGYFVSTMDELVAGSRWPLRVFGSVFGLLAGVALLLASVGLFAITAHSVAQRTQEIGVRTALGAPSGHVVSLFVRRTVWYLALGLVIGLGGAMAASRVLASTFGSPIGTDPLLFSATSALLIVVSGLATWLPARRAAHVDPVVALRYD